MKIHNIKIKNFKSLKDISLSLKNLTLVTGVNSSGKSSFIQTLLLLKQNENIINIKEFKLRGVGNIEDILYNDFDNRSDRLSISLNNGGTKLLLVANDRFEENDDYIIDKSINLFYDSFQYLETNRIPPQDSYDMSIENIDKGLLGLQGEYTAHYLNQNKNHKIGIGNLKHSKALTDRLIENASLWLGEISDGIEISTKIYPELGRVTLAYSHNYQGKRTKQYTPLNVGFGITFILPIIVAILKAKPDDLLIIENPESHLHPKGQSKIAELCSIASANGVQIIIETHSDHFLNGIRIATKNELLTPEDSKIYYFRKDKGGVETKVDEINIDKEGGIDRYPKGFFDQFDEDLDRLVSW